MLSISDQKAQGRLDARRRRLAAQDPSASLALIKNFPAAQFRGAIIGGIWPLKNEIDPRPLMEALSQQGHKIALPCTPETGIPLTFRRWSPGDRLKAGSFETREPFPEQPEVFPTLVLVPLLAFTQGGERLGYGGGFYDRTLAALRARHDVFACGVAYAAQEAPDLPTDEHDQRLDAVLTERFYKAF